MAALLAQVVPVSASADAVLRSEAMFADTIAEYFVEDDHVRLELEIGPADAAAFRNLLPDRLYEAQGFGGRPLGERLVSFVTKDMPIIVDGAPLPARVSRLGPGIRPLRDEITGDALPTPDEQAASVIVATVLYAFERPPENLTLVAPSSTGNANIGFVLYHKGVAVNDYRYLITGHSVQLDWQDPFYSVFDQQALRRQHFSPLSGFIYVEPFEVRKEVIVRPADIQRIVDLGLGDATVITPDLQPAVKQSIVDFLDGRLALSIDGKMVVGEVERVNFLERSLRASIVIDGRDIDLLSATVGVIYTFPTKGLPSYVEMEWDLFIDGAQAVPAATVDAAGTLPTILHPDANTLRWDNVLLESSLPSLLDIAAPATRMANVARFAVWPLAIVAIGLAALIGWRFRQGESISRSGTALLPVLLALVISVHQAGHARLDQQRLGELVGGLLHNVYRAFDYRHDEAVYDVLAQSVGGDLLPEVYLETRRSLELASQGGARVKIKSVAITDVELLQKNGDELFLRSEWISAGSVGHWGHVHERINLYEANMTITVVDGAWKITALDIVEESRI